MRGDIIKLSLGGVVAADAQLISGDVLVDQSMLTGESLSIAATTGAQTYAGALIRRGEAIAEVIATGERTKFGRTAQLIRGAHVVSSQQKAVLSVVRNLAIFNGLVVVVVLLAYATALKTIHRRKNFAHSHRGARLNPRRPPCYFHTRKRDRCSFLSGNNSKIWTASFACSLYSAVYWAHGAAGAVARSRAAQPLILEEVPMIAERDVVVVGGARTAIGDYGGSLKDVAPNELRAIVKRS